MSSDEVQAGVPEVAPQDTPSSVSAEQTDVPAAVAAESVPAGEDPPAMVEVLQNGDGTDIAPGEEPGESGEKASAEPEGVRVADGNDGNASLSAAAAESRGSQDRAPASTSGSPTAGPADRAANYSSAIMTSSRTDVHNTSGTPGPSKPSPAPSSQQQHQQQQQQRQLHTAPRSSVAGRQVIAAASSRADTFISGVNSAGNPRGAAVPSGNGMTLNAQCKTVPEEHAEYRARNKIGSTYRGPVYVVEDTCVACHACGGPVDPVRRVPVGTLFFHESCLHCYLCGRRTGVAGLYVQVDRQALCSDCASRSYDRWVPRQEVQSRNMVYGAIKGNVYAAIDEHDRKQAQRRQPRSLTGGASVHQQQRRVAGLRITAGPSSSSATTLNKATVPGALPPTLGIANVHNRRNTGTRSFALMERQQYYTQSDNNVLMAVPTAPVTVSPTKAGAAHGRGSTTGASQYRLADR